MSLNKIISGGQTGADQGALDAAIKYNFPHGGWIPKGRLTENGPLPNIYKLKQMPTSSYPKRTEQNVIDSDGTLIISRGKLTGGSLATMRLTKKHDRPCLHIDLNKTPTFLAASEIYSWAIEYFIETLNVAGPRASKDPKIYEDVKYITEGLILLTLVKAQAVASLTDFTHEELLGKIPVPPKTVDEAVDLVMSDLDLKLKVVIAKMDIDEILHAHKNLSTYFKNAFGLWSGNKELIESCRRISMEPILNENDATAVLIGILWKKLKDTHSLRAIK